jgi:redox-sensitive bicupin YhaK (pirin superfamily)
MIGSAGEQVGLEAVMGRMVTRVLPGARIEDLNPFIFLDHIGPRLMEPAEPSGREGTGPHPHRGIVTFTYLLEGQGFHRDSLGNRSVVSAGGVQWMKAGKGILHAEGPSPDHVRSGGRMHGLQLWINLPAKDKESAPAYQSRRPDEIEEVVLEGGLVRVLLGSLGALGSTLPVVAHGPFVMNTEEGIARAYEDYQAGQSGELSS